ncbi:MAG: phage tail protein [Dehalococcoidales bacterium]|nr:phage tail protein [Dehalococcoidales bacterium]
MAAHGREDPLVGFNFGLEIEGTVTGYFTEVAGIGSEHEIIEHKVVDDAGRELVMKIPGRLKWGDITLKRGITSDMQIWDWRKKVEEGDVKGARKNGSIFMLDRAYKEVARWDFVSAWPSKVTGPSLKADSNEFGVEELTLVHEGLKRVQS